MGIYALVFGGVMILLAFMLRKRREENVEAEMSARGEVMEAVVTNGTPKFFVNGARDDDH